MCWVCLGVFGVFWRQDNMDIQFKPSLELGEMGGFLDLIDSLCHDIYRQSTKVERLADQTIKGDYMVR